MERENLQQSGDYDPMLPKRLDEIVRQILAEREAARKTDARQMPDPRNLVNGSNFWR